MKVKTLFIAFLFALLAYACVDIESEISMNAAYPGDRLAVIAYLSNKGVVVNVQKTVPVENSPSQESKVQNAQVYLYSDDDPDLKIKLYQADDFNFFSEQDFQPQPGNSYYIVVAAEGFEEVRSSSQVVMNESVIESVTVDISTSYYLTADTTCFFLFGWPRSIYITMNVENSNFLIANRKLEYFVWSGNKRYELNEGKMRQCFYPQYYCRLGMGDFSFCTPVNPISSILWIDDQLETGDSIFYESKKYPVLQRADSITLQFITASSDFIEYFQKTNYYMENRISPFSSLSEKIPSNLSNGIGYFGNISISERVVILPPFN